MLRDGGNRFCFGGSDVHLCFAHVTFCRGYGFWKVLAYQVGGEAWPRREETGVDGGDPCGGDRTECGLVEIGDEVCESLVCVRIFSMFNN